MKKPPDSSFEALEAALRHTELPLEPDERQRTAYRGLHEALEATIEQNGPKSLRDREAESIVLKSALRNEAGDTYSINDYVSVPKIEGYPQVNLIVTIDRLPGQALVGQTDGTFSAYRFEMDEWYTENENYRLLRTLVDGGHVQGELLSCEDARDLEEDWTRRSHQVRRDVNPLSSNA